MITVKKQFAGNILQTVCKHRHHIHFRIPKGLTAVNRARKPVCGNIRITIPPGRLKHLKKRKTYPLLHERIVVDANIRIFPKFMQNVAAPVQKLRKTLFRSVAHFRFRRRRIIFIVFIADECYNTLVNDFFPWLQ